MKPLRYETRLLLFALGAGAPGIVAALWLLWLGPGARAGPGGGKAVPAGGWGGGWGLLRRVMASIDVSVFAFDPAGKLRLVNRAGEFLLAQPSRRLLGRPAAELGLGDALAGPASHTSVRVLPRGWGNRGV